MCYISNLISVQFCADLKDWLYAPDRDKRIYLFKLQ